MRKHLAFKHSSAAVIPEGWHSAKQTTIGHFSQFVSRSRKPANKQWYRTRTKTAMMMCVRDMRPLNNVKGQHFCRLLRSSKSKLSSTVSY